MKLIDAYKLLGVIAEQERWNVPDFVYKSIKEAPTIDIDSIIAEHENIGYEKGFRDGYAEAVDTEPVRHGEWIKDEKTTRCSKCGNAPISKITFRGEKIWELFVMEEYHYCPYCGAKMEGAEE